MDQASPVLSAPISRRNAAFVAASATAALVAASFPAVAAPDPDAKLINLHREWTAVGQAYEAAEAEYHRRMEVAEQQYPAWPDELQYRRNGTDRLLSCHTDIEDYRRTRAMIHGDERAKSWAELAKTLLAEMNAERDAICLAAGVDAALLEVNDLGDAQARIEDAIVAEPAVGTAGLLVKLLVYERHLSEPLDGDCATRTLESVMADLRSIQPNL